MLQFITLFLKCPFHAVSVLLVVPRFQNDFALLSEWLTGSSKLLKTWSNLASTSDLNKESLYTHLIKLLVRVLYLPLSFNLINGKRRKTVIHEVYNEEHKSKGDRWGKNVYRH